jgi:nucleoid-associated protein YgaU
MARYSRSRKITNSSDYYEPLRKRHHLKKVVQYATPILKNPGVIDRIGVVTNQHIWKYGNRFYQLADEYYGDVRFWWVIAWYNGYPTEAHVKPGDVLEIPVNIEKALVALGV